MAGWYKEQIGPLPAGAWVAVVAGGLGITMWSRRHPGPAAAVDTAVAPSADLGPTALPDNSAASSSGGSSAPPPIVTNEDWARIASATLITHGYDPLLVTRALADFLSGNALDDKETAAVQLALSLVGPPPLAPPSPSGVVSTTPPPSTAPPRPPSIVDIIGGEETTPQGATLLAHNFGTYLPESQAAGFFPIGTIPIYAVPAWPPRLVGWVPYGQEITPTGPAIMGSWVAGVHDPNPGAPEQVQFYPVAGGFVSAADVVSKVAA